LKTALGFLLVCISAGEIVIIIIIIIIIIIYFVAFVSSFEQILGWCLKLGHDLFLPILLNTVFTKNRGPE